MGEKRGKRPTLPPLHDKGAEEGSRHDVNANYKDRDKGFIKTHPCPGLELNTKQPRKRETRVRTTHRKNPAQRLGSREANQAKPPPSRVLQYGALQKKAAMTGTKNKAVTIQKPARPTREGWEKGQDKRQGRQKMNVTQRIKRNVAANSATKK